MGIRDNWGVIRGGTEVPHLEYLPIKEECALHCG